MNLANPLALAWAGLLIPVVVFYILKIRLRRVPVSTVIFWRQIFEEKKPRSLWQRLRHLLSLLVQLALLLLLIFALAQPFFAWEANEARRVVLVLDNSASMNATDVAPSRLAAAKELALKAIDSLRHRDEPINCRFEIELNGRPVDVHDLKLDANGKWSQVIEQTSTDGGRLSATLKHDDALAADNTAVAILPKREFQPVLLVTPEPNLF